MVSYVPNTHPRWPPVTQSLQSRRSYGKILGIVNSLEIYSNFENTCILEMEHHIKKYIFRYILESIVFHGPGLPRTICVKKLVKYWKISLSFDTVPRHVLLTIYYSLILPYLHYGIFAWGQCAQTHLHELLQILQRRAMIF